MTLTSEGRLALSASQRHAGALPFRSSRPNLVKACQKTKMCAFFLKGACKRGGVCTYAHDPAELKPTPNLHFTKLCPAVASNGHCPDRSTCKYAHSEAEIRTPEDDGASTTPAQTPQTPPDANAASVSLFKLLFNESNGGAAWAAASRQILMPSKFAQRPDEPPQDMTWAHSADSDTLSQRSTEEGGSEASVAECTSPSNARNQAADGCQEPNDFWTMQKKEGVQVTIQNSFIHFSVRDQTDSSRRASSAPGRVIVVPARQRGRICTY